MSDRRRRTVPGPTGFSTTGNRTALGYWVPLAVTVTVATIGLAAWVWSERSEIADKKDGKDDDDEDRRDGPITLDDSSASDVEDAGMLARMHGALRRTPSPQQIFDGASRRVVSAAGAVFGGALGSIREEGHRDFEDHSRWAEPSAPIVPDVSRASVAGALPQVPVGPSTTSRKTRRSVAIVVSSVTNESGSIEDLSHYASILSRLPEYVDPETAKVFVLIYAPGVQPSAGASMSSSRPTLSVASSYDNIAREEASSDPEMTPVEPQPVQEDPSSSLFKALYSQAQVLVDKETMIMPFNTPNGHVHILRNISPDIVYIQDSLSGEAGEAVRNISGWVRQVVIVATEPESGDEWWQKEAAISRRTAVVDVSSIGEDWQDRVSGRH